MKKWLQETVRIPKVTLVLLAIVGASILYFQNSSGLSDDTINALASLAAVLVAGYGIYSANTMTRQTNKLENLEIKLKKTEIKLENYMIYEHAMTQYVLNSDKERIESVNKKRPKNKPPKLPFSKQKHALREWARNNYATPQLMKPTENYENISDEERLEKRKKPKV